MKNLILFSVIATLIFPLITKADDIVIPIVVSPSVLHEGTQTGLSDEQIQSLRQWAITSKNSLVQLLQNIEGIGDKYLIHDMLIEGVKKVVQSSNPNNSELLMRYILNRGLVIDEIISTEASEKAVGTIDSKVHLMVTTVKMAIAYYNVDKAVMNKKGNISYALFGIDYFDFLTNLNKSILDLSAQFAIEKTAVEWLEWDFYRDQNNKAYASQIVKINNHIKNLPAGKVTDSEAKNGMQQLKSLESKLGLLELIQTIPDVTEAQVAAARERTQPKNNQQNEQRIFKPKDQIDYIDHPFFYKNPKRDYGGVFSYENNIVSGNNYSGITMTIPLIATGDPFSPIDWAATIGSLEADSAARTVNVNGKSVDIKSQDGRAKYFVLGAEGRVALKGAIEIAMKAEYNARYSGPHTAYSDETGEVYDPYGGLNLSMGWYLRSQGLPFVLGMDFGGNIKTHEPYANLTISLRLK